MKRLTSWMLSIFMVMFWVFRVIVAIVTQTEESFGGFIVFNYTIEVALLFITILSFVLIIRRNIIGAILYIVTYGYYFGGYLINNVMPLIWDGNTLDIHIIQNAMVAVLAVLLALFTLIDMIVDKVAKKHYSDSKTDWFFNDKDKERKLDDKADKNQYRIY